MNYIELYFEISPMQPASEILIAELSELGYESFVEEENVLKAYIVSHLFDEKQIEGLYVMQNQEFSISYKWKQVADENWNAKWESEYESVFIDKRCYIRAPFHARKPNVEFEILIEPKMSFGTAHHETTYQMIQLLMEEDVVGKKVLDMGCGTAVLAILAKMKGASEVHAIDNDEWAYNNALENVEKNHFSDIIVEQGDAALLKGRQYDLIIANINKNILLRDMKFYTQALAPKGRIFFSGFYTEDLDDLKKEAQKLGLVYGKHLSKNNWVAAIFNQI